MLVLENVSRDYPARRGNGTVRALAEVNCEISPGQFVAIVGPSGCGKSTLLNLVAGIDQPTSGRLTLKGNPIQKPSPERGLMFQQYALFPWMSVRRNIEFGPRSRGIGRSERRRIGQTLIDLVGLSGFERRYPYELSGGMQQRCALARMLANNPILLLMDEPLAAVDAQTRAVLQEELLRIWGESGETEHRKTVLYVTHSIEEAVYLADRVLVMGTRPGRIISDLPNTLPRPRTQARRDPEFGMRVDEIWSLLHDYADQASREIASA